MAVEPQDRPQAPGPPVRTPMSVPVGVNVTDEYSGGVAGFLERWRSLVVGLSITARRAAGPTKTLRYPHQKITISARWRGALRLRGILGVDEMPRIEAPSDLYAEAIDGLYRAGELPPCVGNCPANVDARGQNYHLADGRAIEAYEVVRSRNIMPGVLGRICHHPCETACRRGFYDEPIAIRPLHRVAFERYREEREGPPAPLERHFEERVAIIGSGPSGLAAAHDLMKLGYGVTMYEKEAKPGGALYSGVPSYRLPREVLHGEIDDLVAMGLDLRLGVEVGVDVPIEHLHGEYDAVLIAVGLQDSRILPLPGTDAVGVVGALEFLKAANWKGEAGVRGKRVLVVGGGNVAVDCARCALRVGATEVRLACLEGDAEMPCHPWEIEEALDEGVIAMCSLGPEEVLEQDGHVVGMKMRECTAVFDAAGRFAPQFSDTYTTIDTDVVVFAIGQASRLKELISGSEIVLTERGLLPVDGTVFTTDEEGIFASGEVVTGPGSAVASIATGHEAATSIHRYLRGKPIREGRVFRPVPAYDSYTPPLLDEVEASRRRVTMPMVRPEERAQDFRQVELGLTHLEGLTEATRCLRCESGVCVGCTFCARTCPDYAIQVERIDDPGERRVTHYDLDLSKCCFCGLCAEQCPTDALRHTGQYELSFYHRDLTVFDAEEMRRDPGGTRATGHDAVGHAAPADGEVAQGEAAPVAGGEGT